MSITNGDSSPAASPRKLKILMLHGYTQSGTLFYAKTRALEKALHKAFPPTPPQSLPSSATASSKAKLPRPAPPGSLPSYPGGIELIYPTAPQRLRPADIPGYDEADAAATAENEDEDAPNYHAWWRRDDRTAEYTGLEEGLATIATAIRDAHGVDGVVGFSQGGAAAAMVASLLEDGRAAAFLAAANSSGGVRYPRAFSDMGPLKFAVSYSGFAAPHRLYGAFYEPTIRTPTLHFIGSLDGVVEESRCLALVEACENARVVYHPGGHFVPIGKDIVGQLVAFIRETCGGEAIERQLGESMI